MSPTRPGNHHANTISENAPCKPHLKISKNSHFIRKSSSPSLSLSPQSSSSSSSSSLPVAGPSKPQQQHPVIIYTHSPKIIHTHPRDFMALVQKLTGLSRSQADDHKPQVKQEKGRKAGDEEKRDAENVGNDDTESSSVITEESCGRMVDGQVNSRLLPPIFEPPKPYIANIPVFTPNSADFLSVNPGFYSFTDTLFFH